MIASSLAGILKCIIILVSEENNLPIGTLTIVFVVSEIETISVLAVVNAFRGLSLFTSARRSIFGLLTDISFSFAVP